VRTALRLTPLVLIAALLGLVVVEAQTPVRVLLVALVLLTCPGLTLAAGMDSPDLLLWVVAVPAISLSTLTLSAVTLLLLGWWTPTVCLVVLAAVTVGAVAVVPSGRAASEEPLP
jgi:hypothetical protein